MTYYLTILTEYLGELFVIFWGLTLIVVTLVTRKRLSSKPKLFILGILLGCALIIISAVLLIITNIKAIPP